MEFKVKVLDAVEKENYRNQYCLQLLFDDAHPSVNFFGEDEFDYFILWIYTMKEYKARLISSWNDYCNPDSDLILSILEDVNKKYNLKCDISSDDVYDIWPGSEEYSGECLARGDDYIYTWYNEDNKQFKIDIIEVDSK